MQFGAAIWHDDVVAEAAHVRCQQERVFCCNRDQIFVWVQSVIFKRMRQKFFVRIRVQTFVVCKDVSIWQRAQDGIDVIEGLYGSQTDDGNFCVVGQKFMRFE